MLSRRKLAATVVRMSFYQRCGIGTGKRRRRSAPAGWPSPSVPKVCKIRPSTTAPMKQQPTVATTRGDTDHGVAFGIDSGTDCMSPRLSVTRTITTVLLSGPPRRLARSIKTRAANSREGNRPMRRSLRHRLNRLAHHCTKESSHLFRSSTVLQHQRQPQRSDRVTA